MISIPRVLCALLLLFVLGACESPEETAARETQFNGKPLAQVVAAIGAPDTQNATRAIWRFSDTQTVFEPIYVYNQYGQARVAGQRQRTINLTCTYTASLSGGRVAASDYQGNSCVRYAPKLPKA